MNQSIETLLGTWSDGPGPLHRKLSDALRRAVELGRVSSGQRLPAERDLAVRLAVSRSTVVTAYDTLRAEGVLESRQGSGTRVGGGAGAATAGAPFELSPVYRALVETHDDLISLACAIFPAHPFVGEAIAEVVADDGPKLLSLTGYVPAGLPVLREALADMFTRDGTPTGPEQVLVTTGAQQAVNLATQLLVRPGDAVVVESPSFAGTLDVFRTRGARLAPAPVDTDGVDVQGVRAALASTRPAAMYLMPTFHNPTGALLAPHRRRELAQLAAESGVPIIEDNALESCPLDDDSNPPPIAALAPPEATVLTAGSLGKAAWGGLRIGWMRGPAALVARLAELKAMNDLGSPLLDQAVAARIVPQLDRMRADHRAMLRRNLELIAELLDGALPAWEWQRPKGGPSLWIRLPAGTASTFAQVALRFGVEVIPGEVMSPTGDDQRYLRFPYSAEPTVLQETVRRLAQAWDAYAPSDATHHRARSVVV